MTPGTKLKAIIAGLLGLALVVLLLTIGYARHTRPDDWEYWDDDDYAGDSDQPAAPVQPVSGAAPVVPSLVPAGLAIPRNRSDTAGSAGLGHSSIDEPTQAFQMPVTGAGPVAIAASSLPIVTLEDLERSVEVSAPDATEPSPDRPPGENAGEQRAELPAEKPADKQVSAPTTKADSDNDPKSPPSAD